MRTRVALTLALLALAATPAAASAPMPAKGSRWEGRTSQGYRITLRVTADGRGVRIDLGQHESCSDGHAYTLHPYFHRQRPRLRADGTFDYLEHDRNVPPPAGMPYRFDQDQHITGTFSGGTVRGTYADSTRFRGGPVCTMKHLSYTATRRRP